MITRTDPVIFKNRPRDLRTDPVIFDPVIFNARFFFFIADFATLFADFVRQSIGPER